MKTILYSPGVSCSRLRVSARWIWIAVILILSASFVILSSVDSGNSSGQNFVLGGGSEDDRTNTPGNASSSNTLVVAAADSSEHSKILAHYICDGVDDQMEINSALDSVGPGGRVVLQEGTFNITRNLNILRDRDLEGTGPENTILSMSGPGYIIDTARNASVPMSAHLSIKGGNNHLKGFTVTGFGWLYISSSNVRVEDVVVRDSGLSLQSGEGRIGQMAAFYIDLENQDLEEIVFERCKAIRVGTNGWRADNFNGEGSPQYFLRNITYIDCEAHTVGRGQYPLPSSSNMYHGYEIFACGFDLQELIQLDGCYVYNCTAIDSWQTGFHFEAWGGMNITLEDCTSVNSGQRRAEYEGIPERVSGRNFMCGQNAVYKSCYSENAFNGGFESYRCKNTQYIDCVDVGSKEGFSVATLGDPRSRGIMFQNCISKDAMVYGFEVQGMQEFTIINGYVENAGGDGEYLNFQSGATNSSFDIKAHGRNAPNIINTDGTGNAFTTKWLTQPIELNWTTGTMPTLPPENGPVWYLLNFGRYITRCGNVLNCC